MTAVAFGRAGFLRATAALSLLLALPACYRPQPWTARAALDELRGSDPPSRPRAAAAGGAVEGAPGEGIDAEQAVALALRDNPDIRALRHARGVAEGQIVAARALANPTVELQLLHIQSLPAEPVAWAIDFAWEPPQPELYAAKGAAARANLEAVKAEIGEQELQLAFDVRAAHAALVSLGEQRALVEQGIELRRKVRDLVEKRVTGGASTRIELGLADLALADVERDRDDLSVREIAAGQRLASLLGLVRAPSVRGAIPDDVGGLPDLTSLEDRALAARPVLAAGDARCLQREEQLRVEHARRWPWFRFSAAPRYRSNETTQHPSDFSVGVQLVLPFLDRNDGPIRVAELQSAVEREQLRKQVAGVRRDLAVALDEIALRRATLERYRQGVLPSLDRHEKLLAAAGSGGQLDLVAVLQSHSVILRSRREYADLRLALHRALLGLERAAGEPLGRKDTVNGGHAANDR